MTKEEASNVDRMRAAWDKWNATKAADIAMWKEYMSPDIKLFSLADGDPRLPFSRQRRGHDELMDYLSDLTRDFAMDHWRIDETVAQDDRVVGIGSTGWTHKGTGKTFVTPIVIVTRWRDGQICEYGEYYDTAGLIASTT